MSPTQSRPVPDDLDRLLLSRIEAHGRLAQAAPGGPEWEAAVACLDEIEGLLQHLRSRPLTLAAI